MAAEPSAAAVGVRRWGSARSLLVVSWVAAAGAIAVRFAGWAADDVYITYRYAQNFAAGRGLVFNPGERVFGVTEPGVSLLLGTLHAVTRIPIPWLGVLLTAGALLGIAVILLAETEARGAFLAGAVGGTLLLTCGFLWDAQGAAAPVVLALLLVAARRLESRPGLAGGLAGLAVWFRPDALVGLCLLGALAWRQRRRPPWRLAWIAAAVVLLGVLLAWAYFGTAIPNTWLAKQHHARRNPGAWIGFGAFWGAGLDALSRDWGAGTPLAVALGILGLSRFWRQGGPAGQVLILNAVALTLIYPCLEVPFFWWYAIPTLAALIYGVAALVEWIAGLARQRPRGKTLALGVGAGLFLLLPLASIAIASGRWWRDRDDYNWRIPVYTQAGRWIRDHSPPGATIGFHEIGILAFTSERQVEDLLGLVSPRSLPYAREGDVEGAFLARPADFFLSHSYEGQGAFGPILAREWFRSGYEEVARFTFNSAAGAKCLTVYRRRPGSSLPPPHPPRPRRLPPDPLAESGR